MSVISTRTRTTLAAGAAVAAFAGFLAMPAAHAGNRTELPDFGDVVVAECADGGQVTGPLEGSISRHPKFDREGNMISLSLNMEYKMTWTLSTTGESVHPHGTRHIVFDFVNGTGTDTGNYRTLTIAGEGRVLKSAGRTISDLESEEILFKSGPNIVEDNDLVCTLFDVEGA